MLSITRKKKPVYFKTIFFPGKVTARIHEEKDLGVVIADKPTWDSHLHLTTAKANKLLGLPAKEIMCLVN